MLYKVNNFNEIEFENIDVSEDQFELPGSKRYKFSDHVCHECWAGGSVLELIADKPSYFCLLCQRELNWVEFKNDFVEPFEGTIKFMLPISYSEKDLENWITDYKEKRKFQEKIREDILLFGKE